MRRMNEDGLLTEEKRESLPRIGEADVGLGDMVAQVRFFKPWSNWAWYAIEFDGKDNFFGYVGGFNFACFSLKELEQAEGPDGRRILLDFDFRPTKIRELRDDRLVI